MLPGLTKVNEIFGHFLCSFADARIFWENDLLTSYCEFACISFTEMYKVLNITEKFLYFKVALQNAVR